MDAQHLQAMQAYLQTFNATAGATPPASTTPPTTVPTNLIDQLCLSQYMCNNNTINPLLAMLFNQTTISAPSLPMYSFDQNTINSSLMSLNASLNAQNAPINNQLLAAMASTANAFPQRTLSNAGVVAPSASSSTSSLATPMRPSASPGSDSGSSTTCRKRRHHETNDQPRSQTNSPVSNLTEAMRSRAFTCPDGVKSRLIAQKAKESLPKKHSSIESVYDISNPVNRHHPDNMKQPSELSVYLEQMAAVYLLNAMTNDPETSSSSARRKVSDKRFRPLWDNSRENTPERDEPEIDVIAVDPPVESKPIAGVKIAEVHQLLEDVLNTTQA